MMTFKEFSKALKNDHRAMELLNKCDHTCKPLTDEETSELVARACRVADEAEAFGPDYCDDFIFNSDWT